MHTIVRARVHLRLIGSERVVLLPPEINRTMWVSGSQASKEYLEEMGFWYAGLALNITPATSEYQNSLFLKFAAPSEYGRLQAEMGAQRVWFYVDPPTTRPMTLAEAEDYDAQSRSSGWRSLWFRGKQPEWYSLRGHPVAVYRGHVTLGTDHAVLLWKKADGDVRELSIHRSVALEPVSRLPERQACAGNPVLAGQLALF
ncbi:MAG: TraE/TraK family type IV conjugative transfer system protein [Halothiobacillaceae bacterium]